MRAQSTIYRDRLSTVLTDGRMRGDFLGGFCIKVSKNELSLDASNTDSMEERGGCTPLSGADGDNV